MPVASKTHAGKKKITTTQKQPGDYISRMPQNKCLNSFLKQRRKPGHAPRAAVTMVYCDVKHAGG